MARSNNNGYGSILEGGGAPDIVVHQEDMDEKPIHSHASRRAIWKSNAIKVALAVGSIILVYTITTASRESKRVRPSNPYHTVPQTTNAYLTPTHHKSTTPLFYEDQKVDHDDVSNIATYPQRYYQNADYFGGPGSPIFVVLGGEDPLYNLLYPFVEHHLAKMYNACAISIEHRFYGKSYPVMHASNANLIKLLSPRQALLDFKQLIQYKQRELGCGPRGSANYCPVMTVGGSYPGFLSALMRIVHHDVIDIGYASSSPLHLYSHDVDPNAYYERITQVADQSSPGCSHAVRTALRESQKHILESTKDVRGLALDYGVCPDKIPEYINTKEIFAEELMMVIANHFADNDMAYYPPGPEQELPQGCRKFQDPKLSSSGKISAFLRMREGFETCFDLNDDLPPGSRATISAADWSGVGSGHSSYYWDFQTCGLSPQCGMSEKSMFPPRNWTLEWLTLHCQRRFDFTPKPQALVNEFGFDDLSNVTRLVFTNGINDGWEVASILTNLSSSVLAVNMVNGAHHSDLTHNGPTEHDTEDVKQAHEFLKVLVGQWLEETRLEYMS